MINLKSSQLHPYRNDIQGLRAIAVLAVVIYHIWPDLLPGGFVGVDAFFVISGFLITQNLVKEHSNKGRIDFRSFYIKRSLRLIPAASVVIFIALVLMPTHSYVYRWAETIAQAAASLFYVQNWLLYREAVDYLAADNSATFFQHFWSLAIEEQFYLFWPVLLTLAAAIAAKLERQAQQIMLVTCVVVTALSFLVCVKLTGPQNPQSYFATNVRLWELALGALLAISRFNVSKGLANLTVALGFALIVFSSVFYSGQTLFPGYAALLPTIGAGLLIAAGSSTSGLVSHFIANRLFVFLGGISYSLYLVHWPLVVYFLPEGSGFDWQTGSLVFMLSVAAAWLLKWSVEDRFRASGDVSWPALKPVVYLTLPCLAAMSLLGLVAYWYGNRSYDPNIHQGAAILGRGNTDLATSYTQFYPSLKDVKLDRATVYDNGCHLRFKDVEPKDCLFGDLNGREKIFLVGDSHAANWYPALNEIALERGWLGSSFTKSSCPLLPLPVSRSNAPYAECLAWGKLVVERIKRDRPDVLVLGQMASVAMSDASMGDQAVQEMLLRFWNDLKPFVGQIVVMADTANWASEPNECVARGRLCQVPANQLIPNDRFAAAATISNHVSLVDMNDIVCPNGICQPVLGNVLIWRDSHHFTGTFSRSMKHFLADRLIKSLMAP